MIQLLSQLAFINKIGQRNGFGAVDEAEANRGVRLVAEYRLTHEQLVEIGVDQGTNDRVDLPFVVIDPCGDVHEQPH